ncbi:MAG: hypothetical protein ISS71_03675 [Phycisphaerae bacterium]|nr:hypothetical protein [Phycisphaerae bacterium]
MKNENADIQTKQGKHHTFKLLKWVLIGTAGLVLLIFFGVPLYLSSSGGTHLLLGKINQSVDGQVQMDDFSIGWFKGVKLTNLSYADNAGNRSVKVRRIETQPKYVSLLGGKVKLGKTLVERPQVYLRVSGAGEETTIKDASAARKKTSAESAPVFPIDQIDLEVIDGSATVELVNGVSQKVQFANIASNVQIAEAGKPSSVDISMDVDDASKISARGTATPAKKGWTLKEGDFEVQISKLQLASLKPLFALAGQEMDMAGELNADATIKIDNNQIQRLKAEAVIRDFAQGTGDQRTVFDQPVKLSALLVGTGDAVKIENAMVQSSFCTVGCAGTLDALNYEVSADLAQSQRFAGQFTDMQGMVVEGQLTTKGKVHLRDERIGVTGTGTAQRLVIQKEGVQTPVTDVQMDFDCAVDKAANQFQLASVNLTATPGTVKIENATFPLSETGTKNISLDAQTKLDLAKTWPFVQVFADLPKDVQLAGMLDSAVKVSTEVSRVRLLTEKTQISQLKIIRPNSEPFQQEKVSLNADVVLDTDNQTIDIRKLDMEAADGQSLIKITKGLIEKKVSKDTTKLSGDFEAQYDLKTLSTMASAFIPEGLTMEGKRTDALHFESQYPTDQPELMNANLNANGTLGFAKAQYQGLNFGPTEVKLNVKQGQAAIDIPDADVNGGKVRFAGDINLTEKPMMLRLRKSAQVVENVKIDDIISAKLLQYLNPVFAKGTGVTGTANLSCNTLAIPVGGGTPKDIDLTGSIGLTDVHLNSPLLGVISGALRTEGLDLFSIPLSAFTVKDGFVRYEDMPMMFGDNFALHFGGAVGLDKSLAMTVKVPSGDSNIPIPLGGTLDHPKPDLSKLLLGNIRDLIPTKDEKTKEVIDLVEGIFNKRQNK